MNNYFNAPIFFYIQNLEPGGAQPVMIGIANELSRRGIEIHLIANSTSGFWRSAIDPEIKLHDLKASNAFLALYQLVFLIKATKPKVIISAMTHANLTAVLARIASFSDAKVVISERHACSKWLSGLRRSRKIIFSRLIPLVYPRADGVIAVANAAADDLSVITRIPRDRIDVIYNAAPERTHIDALSPPISPLVPGRWNPAPARRRKTRAAKRLFLSDTRLCHLAP